MRECEASFLFSHPAGAAAQHGSHSSSLVSFASRERGERERERETREIMGDPLLPMVSSSTGTRSSIRLS